MTDGSDRQQVNAFFEGDSRLWWLPVDDRLWCVAEQLLGIDFVWLGSEGNRFVGNTGWHPDGSELSYRRLKVIFYFESLDVTNGALRVIPGSHRDPLHSALRPLIQRKGSITPYGARAPRRAEADAPRFGQDVHNLPAFPVCSEPGDAIIFDQNLWHSSFGGGCGRQMISFSFAAVPRSDSHERFLRDSYAGQLQHVQSRQWTGAAWLYGDQFLRADDKRIARMTDGLLQRGLR
jgi:ectoine hydroxylase-related dioxygenase (phytanoyl-CoA dioxygenase family)